MTTSACLSAMCACASPVGFDDEVAEPTNEELSVELALLPEEGEARTEALLDLAARFPEHAALRDVLERHNEATDERMGLVVEVEVDGHTVKFYEPEPGAWLVTESAPEGEPMLLGSEGTSRSAVETFAALLPNDEVPAVLVQLDERRAELEDLAFEGEDLDAVVGGGESIASEKSEGVYKFSSDPYAFIRDGGCPTRVCDADVRLSVCHPSWGGGIYAQGTAEHAEWHVASYSGDWMNFRIYSDGEMRGTWFIGAGERHTFNWNGPARTRTETYWDWGSFSYVRKVTNYIQRVALRAEVTNANGDGFHFGGIWWNGGNRECN
ncbi:MAG: hypothetical protein H6723_10820 [Sandaracinus sp.]|nr:hypothetical protein [Myxococcales bacterium]MCB9623811.1 hypothetical protein [Sandaracinus sp.]